MSKAVKFACWNFFNSEYTNHSWTYKYKKIINKYYQYVYPVNRRQIVNETSMIDNHKIFLQMYFVLCVYSYFKDLRPQQLVRMVRIAINIHFWALAYTCSYYQIV